MKVESGVVTLEGTVSSRQEKHMAEDLADSIPGVKDVTNQLRVNQGGRSEGREGGEEEGEGSHMISRSESQEKSRNKGQQTIGAGSGGEGTKK